MATYIYNLPNWPHFTWDHELVYPLLVEVRYRQGRLLGRMEGLGFHLQEEANLQTLTMDVLKSSEIEGELLDPDQVRSSIARRLGMDIGGLIPSDRYVDGVVEMMLDATLNYQNELTSDRFCGWHSALFPAGRSGIYKIIVGSWRQNKIDDPMQVVSGAMGKEKVHFQAPDSEKVDEEMNQLIRWFNEDTQIDSIIKAAIAHLWFVTIHPFEDGNGRIARALADMQLSRSDISSKRFYSMSTQIRKERKEYYDVLEHTQKGSMDISKWLVWFLKCLDNSISETNNTLELIWKKSRFWETHAQTIFNERQKLIILKLMDGFNGKLNSSKWAKITKVSQDTAIRDIKDLMEKGILKKEERGGRSTSYFLQY